MFEKRKLAAFDKKLRAEPGGVNFDPKLKILSMLIRNKIVPTTEQIDLIMDKSDPASGYVMTAKKNGYKFSDAQIARISDFSKVQTDSNSARIMLRELGVDLPPSEPVAPFSSLASKTTPVIVEPAVPRPPKPIPPFGL